MSEYKFNPDELEQDAQQVASLILSDSLEKGERLQDVVMNISSEGEDYINGFEDGLAWVREALLPAVNELGIPATKVEKRGALKTAMVADAALNLAEEAIGSIYEPPITDQNVAVVGCDDDPEFESKQGKDGIWEEQHVFSCEWGSLTLKCLRRDGIACLIAPRVITDFGTNYEAAELFSRWLCLITAAYIESGQRVVYVEAPVKMKQQA